MKGAIMLSGGGSGKLFAAIGVKYNPGETCTCTKDTKVLTAKNTSGQWVFAVPEEGTWKVVAGDKSQDVIITSEGQFESVNLSETVLFENGVEYNTDITGGFEFNESKYVTVGNTITITGNKSYFGTGHKAWDDCGAYYSKQKVTAIGYKYFCARLTENINAASTGKDSHKAWLYASKTGTFSDSNTIARFEIPINPAETGIFKMPLDNVSSAVLGIRVYGANGGQTIMVDKIWLE